MLREYAHASIREGVKKVDDADEEIGDAYEEKVIVVQRAPGVPGKYEDAERDQYAEYLGEAVEKQVVVLASRVQPGQNQGADDGRRVPAGGYP
jgi:hypothetical protein